MHKQTIPGVIYPDPQRLRGYIAQGVLSGQTLAEAFIQSCEANAEQVALTGSDGDVSYAQLQDISNRFAMALHELGLQPLERVLIQVANCQELAFVVIGCLKAGLIPVCTLPSHRELEIGYLGRLAEARAHIVQADFGKYDLHGFAERGRASIPTLDHVLTVRGGGANDLAGLAAQYGSARAVEFVQSVERDPFQVAVFQLSGGTTGVPKIIPRFHNEYLYNMQAISAWLGYRPGEKMFMPMPMIHNASMVCAWGPFLLNGGSFVIDASGRPEGFIELLQRYRPEWIAALKPSLLVMEEALRSGRLQLDQLRGCWSTNAASFCREKLGVPGYHVFGMGEGLVMFTHEGDPEEALDISIGNPISAWDEIRLLHPDTEDEVGEGEIGEMVCRGPYTISGYFNSPEKNQSKFTADGYYRSGDLMRRADIGGRNYYLFEGRCKDVVDRASETISCEEIEHAVASFAKVRDVAVVGMPDEVLGERICAYIVLAEGVEPTSVAELAAYLEDYGLAKFKWPEHIEYIDSLPQTKVGKLDKELLKKDIREKLAVAATA